MYTKKIFILTIALCLVLGLAAFGSDGLKSLFASKIDPARAAEASPEKPGIVTLVNDAGQPGDQVITTFSFVPAPELPARIPDAAGLFGGRDGDVLTLQSSSAVAGGTADFFVTNGTISGTMLLDAAQAGTVQVVGSTGGEVASVHIEASQSQAGAAPVMTMRSTTISGQGEAGPSAEYSKTFAVAADLPGQATTQKVVVTTATQVYQDVTPIGTVVPGENQTIQQVLKAGALDDLNDRTSVTVWGHIDGEQLVADVIVYQSLFQLP